MTKAKEKEAAGAEEKPEKKKREVKKRTVTLYEVQDDDGKPFLTSLGTFESAVKAKQAITKDHDGKQLVIGLMYDPIFVKVEEVPAKYKVKLG